MDYLKLFLGISLTLVFTWILMKNIKRTGFLHSLLRIDTVLGVVAGLYLVINSIISITALLFS